MKDINRLDFNLLKALDALLDERNVTRAASRLGVTQPAMSGMLTRLRDNFDDPLFVRTQRGIAPTQRALALAGPLKQVLGEVGAWLQPAAFDPSTSTQRFTLAATDYALRAVALPFVAALKAQAPHIRVALMAVDYGSLHEQLDRGEVDVALTTPDSARPDLHARHLFDEHYVCVLREGHPAAQGRRRLTLNQFCALDHAVVSYNRGSFRGVTDDALEKLGRQRQVTVSIQSFLILPDILRATDMVSVLPSRLVQDAPGLTVMEPPVEIPGFTKTAVWHERTHREPAHRWLRDLMFETFAEKAEG